MRLLPTVALTAEQLPLLTGNQTGVMVIRGAAGSGKTTTALMRLRQLCAARLSRRTRLELVKPVRVLVLTFNRTLEGYVRALAEEQVSADERLDLNVTTHSRWAKSLVPSGFPLDPEAAERQLRSLCKKFPGDTDFLVDEVQYFLGRFAESDLDSYVTARREGRGTSPRMEEPTRLPATGRGGAPLRDCEGREGRRRLERPLGSRGEVQCR